LGEKEVRDLADTWQMLGAEMHTDDGLEPVIFLVHRKTSQAIVVACWPNPKSVARNTFDPHTFFKNCKNAHRPAGANAKRTTCKNAVGAFRTSATAKKKFVSVPEKRVEEARQTPSVCSPASVRPSAWPPATSSDSQKPVDFSTKVRPSAWAPATSSNSQKRVDFTTKKMPSQLTAAKLPTLQLPLSAFRGDYVEVKHRGQWLTGVLELVDGDAAHVRCDVNVSGGLTIAPLCDVRLVPYAKGSRRVICHMRSKSR